MLWEKPKCSMCEKEINGNDIIYFRMRYPKNKGFAEIKAYLRNEATFFCEDCVENKDNKK